MSTAHKCPYSINRSHHSRRRLLYTWLCFIFAVRSAAFSNLQHADCAETAVRIFHLCCTALFPLFAFLPNHSVTVKCELWDLCEFNKTIFVGRQFLIFLWHSGPKCFKFDGNVIKLSGSADGHADTEHNPDYDNWRRGFILFAF